MTQSLPLAKFRAQIEALSENPTELVVTEQGEPVFTVLPYGLYQSLLETLDVVADATALTTLQENLEDLRAGNPVHVVPVEETEGVYQVGLTEAAYQTFNEISDMTIRNDLLQYIKLLANAPERQGKALVSSLKGYRSLKTPQEKYQIIYFIEKTQVIVVFLHSAVTKPEALLVHLLTI